ncbi:hypothetical protein TSUD_378140 [Trifolium subterraneum]|uniref:Uncharacterized protein n=1 Tax=Trifolium subterraneum TaxID=3900 RepID=A0A2Z6PFC1_TRISU|nr:hypothetical protein TSUD_378140 [Trifolium subterraneum]
MSKLGFDLFSGFRAGENETKETTEMGVSFGCVLPVCVSHTPKASAFNSCFTGFRNFRFSHQFVIQ